MATLVKDQVLNPWLYERLLYCFDQVRVMHPGQEYRTEQDWDGPKVKGGEYYCINCPFCRENRKRLEISYLWTERSDLAHCFNETNCLQHEHNRLQLKQWLYDPQHGDIPETIQIKKGSGVIASALEVPTPGVIRPLYELDPHDEVRLYLEQERDYPDLEYMWQTYGVGLCEDVYDSAHKALVGRIYVPCYQMLYGGRDRKTLSKKLVMWQGRYPADLNWKEVRIPKYYNTPNAPRGCILYNHAGAFEYRDWVLVEGVMDAWRVGPNAVGLLSCKLTPAQQRLIAPPRDPGCLPPERNIAILLDGEAREDAEVILERLKLDPIFHGRVFIVELDPGVDPDCWNTKDLRDYVLHCARKEGIPFSFDARRDS